MASGINFQQSLANLRHRVEAHLEERRIRAQLDTMSERRAPGNRRHRWQHRLGRPGSPQQPLIQRPLRQRD